jgi:LysR family transcriptional regulator for bpeEF and oprC
VILGELQEAEDAVAQRRARLRGKLRVQMPVGFGQRVVLPLMTRFVELNPDVTFDTELSDRESDLADEGLDLAIRIGKPRDAGLIARRLCDMRFITVASPRYLEQHGEPSTPEELESHRCLMFYFPHAHRYRAWHFDRDGKRVSRLLSGAININHPEALLEAAISGAGITNVPTFIAYDAVRSGLLRVVLRGYASLGPPVSLVYLQRRLLPLRVQAFADFLAAEIAPSPAWDAVLA